jgi:CHASE2 domain-containing sensor protein
MVNSATATQSKTQTHRSGFRLPWPALLTGWCLSIVTLLTGLNSPILEQWQRQLQTLFFEVRGPQVAPDDIVIFAIDDESLSQAEHYRTNPDQYADLASIQQWPWQRQAYAIAIQRLMDAGAKAVSLDIVLSTESAYGPADDQTLRSVLEQYGDHVTLAIKYEDNQLRQGSLLKPTLPLPQFRDTGIQLGNINFPLEADGRIHRQGHTYLQDLRQAIAALNLEAQGETATDWDNLVSFAEATLTAAQVPYDTNAGTHIHFWGPTQTFRHIPFWYVLDADLWHNYLQSGQVFQDKIVLVGSTASTAT